MRPERDDIASPDLPAGMEWIGAEPESMPALTAAGPAIVHFLDFAQLNSVRTLPYLEAWWQRYRGEGVRVIGVQAPRFPFGAEPEPVRAGLERLGVTFPVAIDASRELWHRYGCEGWPSLFLWSLGGALAWAHFGEGEYLATESALQDELRELDALRSLPAPLEPLRPSDVAGAQVLVPSPEILPGGSYENPWTAGADGEELALEYEAGGAWATIEGEGRVALALDGAELEPLEVDGAGLYPLAIHARHEAHTVALRPEPGVRVWSVSYEAGIP